MATSTRFNASISRASRHAWRGALSLAVVATWIFLLAPEAQARIALYKVDHRMASELLPYAELSMGNEGKAQLDTNRNAILLVGDDASIARTLSLLKAQDTAARTIQLLYEHISREELREHDLNIQWRGNYGHIILGEGRPVPQEGLYVRLRERQRSGTDRFQGQLMILEGQSGRIATGRSVPIQTRSKKHGTHTEFVEAESGFEATPTVLGSGKIRLELRPFRAEVQPDGKIAFTEASTIIVLSPEESIVLGGTGQQTDETGTYGLSDRQHSDDQLLMITAILVGETDVETDIEVDGE